MKNEQYNHTVGCCSICDGVVKCMRIEGWGLVPESAKCLSCGALAAHNKGSLPYIKMVEPK